MNSLSQISKLKQLHAILSFSLIISFSSVQATPNSHTPADSHQHREHQQLQTDTAIKIPHNLSGLELVLQIENAQGSFNGVTPHQGAIVKRYSAQGSYSAQSTAILPEQGQEETYGSYKYLPTGPNTAIEKSINRAANNTPSTTRYIFESATSGTWEEDIAEGQLKLSGSFSLEESNLPLAQHYAPISIANTNVALIIHSAASDLPVGSYPSHGLVLQTYMPDGTLSLQGFGPGTINSRGTYSYTKISAHSAVEEVTQISDYFTLPYTMVYTFETPTSGRWFQNLGDGLIKFQGTFNTFPN